MSHFDSGIFAYLAVLTLDDDSEVLVDLEVHGWAEPERLARVRRFALIPKPDIAMPPVVINIPAGAKPVFKSTRMVSGPIGVRPPLLPENATVQLAYPVDMRCYAVGYKRGTTEVLTWILPTGGIEVGPKPSLADILLKHLSRIPPEQRSL